MDNDNNSFERDDRLRTLINKGTDIVGGAAGSAVGTVIGSLLVGPGGAVVGGSIVATATMAVRAIGHELSSRMLSPREQARVGGVFTLAAAEIVKQCRNGDSVRDDGFFYTDDSGRSDAEDVWETMLLKSQREAEEKKLPYMAHLLANLAFTTEILGGPGQLDRFEVELSESPAAPANDTNTRSGGASGIRTRGFPLERRWSSTK